MNEEITPSQNKELNFVLKLPDLNKDLITPINRCHYDGHPSAYKPFTTLSRGE